jgi:uncharacterized membrane protein
MEYVLTQRWIMLKLFLTLILLGYQLYCWKLIAQLESKHCNWNRKQMRIFNEMQVLLLL